jgi:hypothetical protein
LLHLTLLHSEFFVVLHTTLRHAIHADCKNAKVLPKPVGLIHTIAAYSLISTNCPYSIEAGVGIDLDLQVRNRGTNLHCS